MALDPSSPPDDLPTLRQKIDAVNMELLRLLNCRADLAQRVGVAKRHLEAQVREGNETVKTAPFFSPTRESQIFDQLAASNEGPLEDEAILAIFREIISQCRALEEPMNVAYWGPQGSHCHVAAIQRFGTAACFVPAFSVAGVFDQVEKHNAHYGVIPAGNSIEGVMTRTLDLLAQRDPHICAEVYLPMSYDLVSPCRSLEEIRRLYASEQPLSLCSSWIAQHLPKCEIVEVAAISRATEACLEDPEGAAIATPLAAEQPGLHLLQPHIEDDPRTRGRFFIIGFNEPARSDRSKTSLLLSMHHEPGTLVRALEVFGRYGVNLTFVQSRHAVRKPHIYRLFVDVQGFVEDEHIAEALAEMTRNRILFEILGSYPDDLPPTDEPTD